MTDRNARPHFVAFTFDYACSECWPDLPRQREAFRRLVSSWSPYVTRELSELDGAASPTDVMIALEALLFSGLGEQDAVIIYIGGHGARLGNDHFIVGPHPNPANLTSRTGLSATDLAHVVGQAKPCQVTLLVDACY